MGRWEPDAQGRLRAAALELWQERGFDQTSAADIAERAGVTERTFFRHFADKREVLFNGTEALQAAVLSAVVAAPASASPIDVVGPAMERTADVLGDRRDYARKRSAVIAANPGLLERELLKFATLADAVAGALRERGVTPMAASLAAETGVMVFKLGFEAWISDEGSEDLAESIRDALTELKALTAES
jgi:AcrR family transcriptional regulator